jgi:hypothetical protein
MWGEREEDLDVQIKRAATKSMLHLAPRTAPP